MHPRTPRRARSAGAVAQSCERHGIPVHAFAWSEAAKRAGYEEDAAYLVRPDAYVGWAATGQASESLEAYLARHKVAPLA